MKIGTVADMMIPVEEGVDYPSMWEDQSTRTVHVLCCLYMARHEGCKCCKAEVQDLRCHPQPPAVPHRDNDGEAQLRGHELRNRLHQPVNIFCILQQPFDLRLQQGGKRCFVAAAELATFLLVDTLAAGSKKGFKAQAAANAACHVA